MATANKVRIKKVVKNMFREHEDQFIIANKLDEMTDNQLFDYYERNKSDVVARCLLRLLKNK